MRQMVRLLLLALMCSMILLGCGGGGGSQYSESDAFDIWQLAVQPGNSSVVFAATGPGNAGVPYRFYRSNDGGVHWQQIKALAGYHIKCIAFDPSNPSTIYVGSDLSNSSYDTGSILRSTDNGVTWTKIRNFDAFYEHNMRIIVDPGNASNIAYVDWLNFSRSTDGGQTWTEKEYRLQIYDLISVPNSSTLYLSGQLGLDKSDDFGTTWVQVNSQSMGDSGLAINPQNPSVIYTASYNDGVAKSSDGGVHWNNIFPPNNTHQVLVDPTNPSNLYVRCFVGLYKSTDGGGTWHKISNYSIESMAIDPSDGSVLYLGTYNRGVLKSTDGGVTWKLYEGGLGR